MASEIVYHKDVIQGSEEWHALRKGVLTASNMDLIITPSLKIARNEKEKQYLYELLAQRVNTFSEDNYQSLDMLRGHEDEIEATAAYSKKYAPVEACGFVTNNKLGFLVGCSPDGLVGSDGGIQNKSRKAKYQMQTILSETMPDDYKIQVQTELFVTQRKWWDFNSYCGGMHMITIRIEPDPIYQEAIEAAATAFEDRLFKAYEKYNDILLKNPRLVATERKIHEEIQV